MLKQSERTGFEPFPAAQTAPPAVIPVVLFQRRNAERLARLSPREEDVLQLIVCGASNKQMAAALDISIKTVEKHRGKLMKKLGVRTIPDLMRIWLQAHPQELVDWRPVDD